MSTRNRLTDILLDYWEEVRGDRRYPPFDEFDKKKLGSVWDNVFIISVTYLTGGTHPVFHNEYIGKNLDHEWLKNNSGKYVRELVVGMLDSVYEKYNNIINGCEPLYEENAFQNKEGKALKYRQVLLPFGDHDAGEVTHIVGGMRFIADDELEKIGGDK